MGEKQKAGEVLTRAFEVAQSIDDVYSKITILDMIAEILAKDGQFDKADEVTKAIEDAFTKAAAPDRIADVYGADRGYDKSFLVAKTIEGAEQKAYALKRISQRARKEGQSQHAQEIILHAQTVAPLL